jgi:hypothetical protein
MFKHFITFSLFIITCSISFSEPSPFGMEINKSTYEEIRNKYSGTNCGINKYSNGKMYKINCCQIEVDGIKEIVAIFDKNDKLMAITAVFNKTEYNSLVNSLSNKYQLMFKKDAFVGSKVSRFQSDNTLIEIKAPHMSFSLTLAYMHKSFEELFLYQVNKDFKQKKQKEKNLL